MTAVNNKVPHHILTWNEFEGMIQCLIHDIKYSFDGSEKKLPTGVFGLPRGGLVMAAVISNRLGIPMLLAPCKDCIVVDDLADSGVTLKHYADCGYNIACWGYKEKSIVKPNWYYEPFAENEWLVFPWECDED